MQGDRRRIVGSSLRQASCSGTPRHEARRSRGIELATFRLPVNPPLPPEPRPPAMRTAPCDHKYPPAHTSMYFLFLREQIVLLVLNRCGDVITSSVLVHFRLVLYCIIIPAGKFSIGGSSEFNQTGRIEKSVRSSAADNLFRHLSQDHLTTVHLRIHWSKLGMLQCQRSHAIQT